jgi:paraquat-inducible protein B
MASVDTGSPVFFRRLRAGQVTSYSLNPDGKGVTLKVFVNEPYDKYVGSNTRFWGASGIDMKIDANGVTLDTESLISILLGGIAFETPEESGTLVPVGAEQKFTLFQNRAEAMKNPDADVMKVIMVFNESARGLTPGAPVDFRGIIVGEVAAIKVDFDTKARRIVVPVEINLYPMRMVKAARHSPDRTFNLERTQKSLSDLVAHGLRGQLRSGSLITGQLYIALDFFPQSPKAKVNWVSGEMAELPTTPGTKQEIQEAITSVANKLEKMPLDEIGKDVRTALASADRLLKRVDTDVAPDLKLTLQSGAKLLQRLDAEVSVEAKTTLIEARKALASADRLLATDAPLQHDTRQAMHEIARAAHAFRMLADYIERNPQALLLGKKGDAP